MRSRALSVPLIAGSLLLLPGAWTAAQDQPPQPLVHFHHVHLNAMYPDLAMQWYTRHFEAERAKFGGTDALWVGKSWILFDKVDQTPPWKITTALYHIGWGAKDAKADFQERMKGRPYSTKVPEGQKAPKSIR